MIQSFAKGARLDRQAVINAQLVASHWRRYLLTLVLRSLTERYSLIQKYDNDLWNELCKQDWGVDAEEVSDDSVIVVLLMIVSSDAISQRTI